MRVRVAGISERGCCGFASVADDEDVLSVASPSADEAVDVDKVEALTGAAQTFGVLNTTERYGVILKLITARSDTARAAQLRTAIDVLEASGLELRRRREPVLRLTARVGSRSEGAHEPFARQNGWSAVYGTSSMAPTVAALQLAAAGAGPPVVAIRWMNVVSARRPGLPAGDADSSSHGIAVGSTVTPSMRWPTTMLPSLACHDGPA